MDPTAFGKSDPKTFNAIIISLRDKPENLIFLTDSPRGS